MNIQKKMLFVYDRMVDEKSFIATTSTDQLIHFKFDNNVLYYMSKKGYFIQSKLSIGDLLKFKLERKYKQ